MDTKIQEELRREEYNPDIVSKESLIKKVAKAGLITLVASNGLSKIGKAKKIDFLKNDLTHFGVATGVMLATSNDDDTVADIGAVGAVSAIMGLNGIGKYKVKYSTVQDFDNIYKTFDKINQGFKELSMFSTNFSSNVKSVGVRGVGSGITNFMSNDSDSYISKGFSFAKGLGGSLINDLVKTPIQTIKDNGVGRGLYEIYKKTFSSQDYELYKKEFSKYDLGTLKNLAEGIKFDHLSITDVDYDSITSEQYKKFIKYKTIEKNNVFTDILGRYTTYDKKQKQISANISKILEDDAHFGNPLNILAQNFKLEYTTQKKEISEEAFVSYLKENGFGDIVDKYYKKSQYLSYGEVSEMFTGKFKELSNEVKEHLYYGKKSNLVNSDYNNNLLFGFKNNDILSNFAFTNVIEKSANSNRIIDNTALDGFNTTLNILGILEKNITGHYKGMVGRTLNMWSPFSLIQSEARIKNNIHNNLLKFTQSNDDIIKDGKLFTYDLFSHRIDPKLNKKIEMTKIDHNYFQTTTNKNSKNFINTKENDVHFITAQYYKSDTSSIKVDFKKTTKDVLNEDFTVRKENAKNSSTLKDIYNTYKAAGVKAALQEMSYSNFNPFGFRYDNGKGLRRVLNNEGYYKEGTIFNDVYEFIRRGKKEIKQEEIAKDNKYLNDIMKYRLNKTIKKNISMDEVKEFFKEQIINDFQKVVNDSKLNNAEVNELLINSMKYFNNNDMENFVSTLQKLEGINLGEKNSIFQNLTSSLDSSLMKIKEINESNNEKIMNNLYSIIESKEQSKFIDYINSKQQINSQAIKEELDFYNSFLKNKEKAKEAIFTEFNNKYKIKRNNLETYLQRESIEKSENIFNPIYEEVVAFENTKFFEKNKDKINDTIITAKNDMTKLGNEYKELEKELKDIDLPVMVQFRQDLINKFPSATPQQQEKIKNKIDEINQILIKNYKKSEIEKDYEEAKKINPQSLKSAFGFKDENNFQSYKQLNDIYAETIQTDEFKAQNLNLFQLKERHLQENFKMSPNNTYVSTVISSSFEKALETKNVLNAVKSFIEKINLKYNSGTIIKTANKSSNFRKANKEIVSSFDLSALTIFSKFQDAAEVIGIEKLTRKTLGNNATSAFKNFFKYRYLPIMGLALGGIALNSFSDMIIPDEVPIIGNGIVGVGTRAYGAARVGLQYGMKYTGMLSVLRTINNMAPGTIENGFTHFFDPLMDPSEMIDVYFYGKPIEVKKNRNWFTAGRQSAEGEEFGQYRPHLLYIMGNPSSGIYSNKAEKFFRKDFALTKYPWYILDPYKEEREAYQNLGLVHPKTEQLFKDIPIFGHLLSATIGEVIKPTQYIGEQYWKVGDNLMKNPNYDQRNPYSPKYIEFTEPNRLSEAFFEGVEDLKTFSGLPGYMITKMTEFVFGATNPYENKVTLSSLDKDTSYYRAYEKLQLGGMFGTTEAIRRLLDDSNGLGSIDINPLTQKTPKWMPDYFKNGNNLYSSMDYTEYMIPGRYFDKAPENRNLSQELKEMRSLSMIAPKSEEFKNYSRTFLKNLSSLTNREREYFYESLSYADEYGKRDYLKKYDLFTFTDEKTVGIKKKIGINEFIGSDNKRYKLAGLTSDFNKLSKTYGSNRARKLMDELNNTFQEGNTYTFKISSNLNNAVGTDDNGDFIKVDSDLINQKLTVERNEYRRPHTNVLGAAIGAVVKNATAIYAGSARTMEIEKIFGNRTAYQEWAYENVHSPYFRDWDSPVSSFVEPYYTMSSNSLTTGISFFLQTNNSFLNSKTSQLNLLGVTSMMGILTTPINAITGHVSTSSDYKKDTKIQDEIEKIKFISGEKSYYNMTGKESLKQFSKMLNEQDAQYFEGLVNTTTEKERNKILATSNARMRNILTTIWERQKSYVNGEEFQKPSIAHSNHMVVTNIGAYTGNVDNTRNLLKSVYGISHSKLDRKREVIIKSYRGGVSQKEGDYISRQMYGFYNNQPYISSTISPIGNINITRRERD